MIKRLFILVGISLSIAPMNERVATILDKCPYKEFRGQKITIIGDSKELLGVKDIKEKQLFPEIAEYLKKHPPGGVAYCGLNGGAKMWFNKIWIRFEDDEK